MLDQQQNQPLGFDLDAIICHVPSTADWDTLTPIDGVERIDLEHARSTFGGKTVDEAYAQCVRQPMAALDDLRHVSARIFGYYVQCVIRLLTSEDGRAQSDAASIFLRLIEDRFRHKPDLMAELYRRLLQPAAEFVAAHQTRYRAPTHIYGNFQKQLKQLERLCSEQERGNQARPSNR